MDITSVVPWLSAVAFLISIGTSVTIFLTSGSKKNAVTLEEHERRISSIENELKHLPDRDTAYRLEMSVQQMRGQIDVLTERLKPIASISERLQEMMLEKSR